jgi:hypothetical protein
MSRNPFELSEVREIPSYDGSPPLFQIDIVYMPHQTERYRLCLQEGGYTAPEAAVVAVHADAVARMTGDRVMKETAPLLAVLPAAKAIVIQALIKLNDAARAPKVSEAVLHSDLMYVVGIKYGPFIYKLRRPVESSEPLTDKEVLGYAHACHSAMRLSHPTFAYDWIQAAVRLAADRLNAATAKRVT